MRWELTLNTVLLAGALAIAGCRSSTFDAARATRPYPLDLHRSESIDVQVFRDGTELEIVNSTANTWQDVDLWINQRYMHHIDQIPAGATIDLSLWDFYDERGEQINAGGFFATYESTPVRLVQLQTGPNEPLIGFITIRDAAERE